MIWRAHAKFVIFARLRQPGVVSRVRLEKVSDVVEADLLHRELSPRVGPVSIHDTLNLRDTEAPGGNVTLAICATKTSEEVRSVIVFENANF